MKSIKMLLWIGFLLVSLQAFPQGKFSYAEVGDDPYKARIYTLRNGMTVMLTVNKAEPRMQTMIAIKAGSKNDPPDNTGLAHYLEHLMFKGTESYGTVAFETEQNLLGRIEALYNFYGQSTDTVQRRQVYRMIDSFSYLASKYAIANEYDRMMQNLGATGTNAFTAEDETVYIDNIPQNQLEKWLKIQKDRFFKPVFRLFHTELEAVYEEKNRTLDNDDSKVFETLFRGLFEGHPYGTQTTIGTVEHLKNPSLAKIREFYSHYYSPNNMALIISGDFDYDETIVLIDRYMGTLPRGGWDNGVQDPDPEFKERLLNKERDEKVMTVTGPTEERVVVGYAINGARSEDALLVYMTDMILSNQQAGLLDIDLNQQQKVGYAYSTPIVMSDYSAHILVGYPKEGQTLEECRNLMLAELDKLKKGDFDEKIMPAIVENLRLTRAKEFNDNYQRCSHLLEVFAYHTKWKDYVDMPDRLEKLTKDDIMKFAQKVYTADRTTIYKTVGKDTTIQKIEKPQISPVELNRDKESMFARRIYAENPPAIPTGFINFDSAVMVGEVEGKIPMEYVKNNETDYFALYYRFDMGTQSDMMLEPLQEYISFLSTDKYSAEQIAREFYNLACEFGFHAEGDNSYLYLKGLQKNFDKALELFEHFITHAKADNATWNTLVDDILKRREEAKGDKNVVLRQALLNYARYGKDNPFTHQLNEKELRAIKATDLEKAMNTLTGYKHKIWYYGPAEKGAVITILNNRHKLPEKNNIKPPKTKEYKPLTVKENTVYFVDFDMVQAEVLWDHAVKKFDPKNLPAVMLFNEYFGGGMYSLVFQTIRESKALAYSTYSAISTPNDKEKPAFVVAYVGTQADKLGTAMTTMKALMDTLPTNPKLADAPRQALKKQLESERFLGETILVQKEEAEKLGFNVPVGKYVYGNLDLQSAVAMVELQKELYSGQPFNICVIGSKDKIDMNELKKFGRVKELSMKDIFGY